MKPEAQLIKTALDILQDAGQNQGLVKDNKIQNKYKGYVASFGGTVVQMGIMPACMAFCVDDNKKRVAALMFGIYKERFGIEHANGLDSYLKDNWLNWAEGQRKVFRSRMTRVAVSLKLAMRSYEFDESEPLD